MDLSDSGYTAGVIILKTVIQLRVKWKTGHSLATEWLSASEEGIIVFRSVRNRTPTYFNIMTKVRQWNAAVNRCNPVFFTSNLSPFYPMPPDYRQSIAFLKIPWFRPFFHLVIATCRMASRDMAQPILILRRLLIISKYSVPTLQ
jgi:hypothetical protein